jgi:hypothetical protein
MLSFLREADSPDGTPGPLSMRRVAAAGCFLTAIASSVIALVFCRTALAAPGADWKACVPLFIPSIAFLVGGILLLYFTTAESIKTFAQGIAEAVGDKRRDR